MRNYFIFGAALTTVLAGCAPFQYTETPLATNFETTKQHKLQAAHHWQMIANSMADTLADALANGSACVASAGKCPTLFVEGATPQSAFGKGFRAQFISRLVNKGQLVATHAPGDIVVTVEAQTVKFSPDRSQYMGAGKFTLLTSGLWVLHNLAEHSNYHHVAGVGALGIAATTDIIQWNMAEFANGPTPQIELILTTSAVRDGKFVARTTNVYYIADSDASLYCWKAEGCDNAQPKPLPPPPTMRVVGDCGPAPCVSTGAPAAGGDGK